MSYNFAPSIPDYGIEEIVGGLDPLPLVFLSFYFVYLSSLSDDLTSFELS